MKVQKPSEGCIRKSEENLPKVINLGGVSMKNQPKTSFYLILFASSFFLFYGCQDDEPCTTCQPNGQSTVQLTLDYVECKEVWLKLSFTDANQPRGYAILRDGNQILSGTLLTTDTLLIDTTTVAGHDYTYTAQRLGSASSGNGSSALDSSTPLSVRTLDSTSHTIQWHVDTLGAQGVIRDVWIFDRNNAWAVGEIYLKDSNGHIDMGHPYGAAHWNGDSWSLLKLPAQAPTYISNLIPTGIFAFAENDIWMISGGVHRFNGDSITNSYWINPFPGNPNPILSSGQTAEKLWGVSERNLYAVGRGGGIAYFNGSSWTKMTSNTTVDLQDIYGLDENHIWAIGTNSDHNGTVILSFNGARWNNLYEGNQYGFSSVWIQSGERLTIAGDSGPWKYDLRTRSFIQMATSSSYVMFCVCGTDANDVFFTGQHSEITHFNGSTYYLYQNIQSLTETNVWWNTLKVKEDFIVVGGSYYNGLYSAPIILRGYR